MTYESLCDLYVGSLTIQNMVQLPIINVWVQERWGTVWVHRSPGLLVILCMLLYACV